MIQLEMEKDTIVSTKSRKNKRQKNYNYTARHDKMAKIVKKGTLANTKVDIFRSAGYTQADSPTNRKGVAEMVKDLGIPQLAVVNIKSAMEAEDLDRDERENAKLRLDASVIGLKLSGDFIERQKVDSTVDIKIKDKQTLQDAFTELVQGKDTKDTETADKDN